MNISFENKVALVTGAASGLGLATAKAFAESGASVALADWNEAAVRSAAEELTAQGVRRDKAALSSGCESHPATAPAGSNGSSHGGNEVAEAFG